MVPLLFDALFPIIHVGRFGLDASRHAAEYNYSRTPASRELALIIWNAWCGSFENTLYCSNGPSPNLCKS